jgi:hypothetical protein
MGVSALLCWIQIFGKGLEYKVESRHIGFVQAGIFDTREKAEEYAMLDKNKGGAGFVYVYEDKFVVLSGLSKSSEELQKIDIFSKQGVFFSRDSDYGTKLMYSLNLPLDLFLNDFSDAVDLLAFNQTSLAFVERMLTQIKTEYLLVKATLEKLNNSQDSLSYLELINWYGQVVDSIESIELNKQNAVSTLRYFMITCLMSLVEVYNTIFV